MIAQRRSTVGKSIALGGSILATLAFLLFPYISGISGSFTAVQIAITSIDILAPTLCVPQLEFLIALMILVLVSVSWSRRAASDPLPLILISLSGLTLLVMIGYSVVQTQRVSLFSSGASFYASGFWLYIVGIAVVLIGGIIQIKR